MSERERKDNSLLICENLIMMPQIEQANTVMLYAPMQDEADVGWQSMGCSSAASVWCCRMCAMDKCRWRSTVQTIF